MIESADFPHLTPTNHRVTSPSTPDYNCIAWSVGDVEHWWQPGLYWPIPDVADFGTAELVAAFSSLGF